MDFKDLTNEKDMIHCETNEESERILKLLHKNGYKWSDGTTYKHSKHGRWELGKWTGYLINTGRFGFADDKFYNVYSSKLF